MKTIQKISLLSLTAVCLTLTSCGNDDDITTTNETSDTSAITDTSVVLHIDLEAQSFYPMHFVDNAESSTEDIEDAQELLSSGGSIPVMTKDDFLYVNDWSGSTFNKYSVNSEGVLVEEGKLPNLGSNGNALFDFVDENTLLMTSKQTWPSDGVYSYQLIDINSMTQESTGTIELPIQGTATLEYSYMWANDYIMFEDNLYIPFVEVDAADDILYDEAYVAVYNSNFEYVKTITTPKTANLATGQIVSSAIDESGDLYLSSSNISIYAHNSSLPSGIVRIKSGETDFDEDYFIDITEATGYDSYGMLYVGDGKAIVSVYNSDLRESSDYYLEYHLVDLSAKTLTKLDMPLGTGGYYGGRRSMALLSNGNAAIMLNHEGGSSIYIYDNTTGSISEGTSYTGADGLIGLTAF